MSQRATAPRRVRAFTLIEVLAVVAILALVAMLVVPNLGALRQRRVRHAAERLAAELEFARQRAVATGIPHRMVFDLDHGVYRLEWLGGSGDAEPDPVAAEIEYDVRGDTPLPLSAPRTAAIEFGPVPDTFGNVRDLEGDVVVAGVATAEGDITRGQAAIVFERDGTASPAEIVLEEPGGARQILAVQPLDDAVRFVDQGSAP